MHGNTKRNKARSVYVRRVFDKVALGQLFCPSRPAAAVFPLPLSLPQCCAPLFVLVLLIRRTRVRSLGSCQQNTTVPDVSENWTVKCRHFVLLRACKYIELDRVSLGVPFAYLGTGVEPAKYDGRLCLFGVIWRAEVADRDIWTVWLQLDTVRPDTESRHVTLDFEHALNFWSRNYYFFNFSTPCI